MKYTTPSLKMQGILTVIAGFILQFINGSGFMNGNIVPYIKEYFHSTSAQSQELNSFFTIFQMFGNFIGCLISNREIIHPKLHIFIGMILAVVGIQISITFESIQGFGAIYTLCYGFSTGFIYSTILYQSWLFFPGREGLVTGIIKAGFGIGGFVFITLSTQFVNPHHYDLNKEIVDPESGKTVQAIVVVARNLPSALSKISIIFVAIFLISIGLTFKAPKLVLERLDDKESMIQEEEEEEAPLNTEPRLTSMIQQSISRRSAYISEYQQSREGTMNLIKRKQKGFQSFVGETEGSERVSEILVKREAVEIQELLIQIEGASLWTLMKTRQFVIIYLMFILSIFVGLFFVSSSKAFGLDSELSDNYFSIVLSIASIAGALRFFWSFLLEKYSFKYIYGILLVIQMILGFTTPLVFDMEDSGLKKALVMLYVSVGFNLEGGHFVLQPTILAKLFGANGGIRTFAIAFSFVGIASFTNVFILDIFLPIIGYSGICYIYTSFSLLAFLILIFVFKEERVKISSEYKNLIN